MARRENKYSSSLIELPVPRLVVFYNGRDDRPDEQNLYLSDAFPEGMREQADIQVHVRMVNVNMGRSPELMNACRPLMEYAWIVGRIRSLEKGVGLEAAIDQTIDAMPNDFFTKPYLMAHKAEVKTMLLTEYNETLQKELFIEEGMRKGRKEGLQEGLQKGLQKGLQTGLQKGEKLFPALVMKLTALGRGNDIVKAASDPAYREQLYGEFQIN